MPQFIVLPEHNPEAAIVVPVPDSELEKARGVLDKLAIVYQYGQKIQPPVSEGDIILLEDRHYRVERIGWSDVTYTLNFSCQRRGSK